ncbi:MAG: transglutaminase-like domain-containing protein [Acidobacteriota bacterium]
MPSGRKLRWLIGGLIVAFWSVMVGLLLHRELEWRGRPAAGAEVARLDATETWYAISTAAGQALGFAHLTSGSEERLGRSGKAVRLDARLRLRAFGTLQELEMDGAIWREPETPRAEIAGRVRSGGHEVRLAGVVAGGELRATLSTGGERLPLRLALDPAILGEQPARLPLAIAHLGEGEETTIRAFDPVTLRPGEVQLRGLGTQPFRFGSETITANVVAVHGGAGGLKAWIAPDGDVLQAETPFGLTLRKVTREQALAASRGTGAGDLAASLLIRPRGQMPFRAATRMVALVTGLAAGQQLPIDDSQKLQAPGRYVVFPAPVGSLAGNPPRPASPPPAELTACLASDALVQSDHPRIRGQAERIVGNEADPWWRALLIYDWVYRNIAKRPVASLPSALDVLASREGDCNEHAVLYTALARAAGLPARIAVGLTWSEELGGFGYHAWPEVFVGRWVWVDPTLGQPVADATHLKLLAGGMESWPQLLSYLGQLQIEVLEVE